MLNLRQARGGAVANLDGCLSKTGILKVFCGSGEYEGDACFAAGYAVAGFGGMLKSLSAKTSCAMGSSTRRAVCVYSGFRASARPG